jgi:hypothetical protein
VVASRLQVVLYTHIKLAETAAQQELARREELGSLSSVNVVKEDLQPLYSSSNNNSISSSNDYNLDDDVEETTAGYAKHTHNERRDR